MTHIAKAILAIDPTAQVSVNAEDLNQITWHDGNPNGITAEQITEKQAALVLQEDADAVAEVENKASAKSKLSALGLSEEEISAAFGI
tara:strand:- start:108 stop:371 length:264 start_codon:yes stop_codon:yes gene_type:complete